MYKKENFLVNFFVLLVVRFDHSLLSSVVLFTFTSLGSKKFNVELISPISYSPGGRVYPIDVARLYFMSNTSTNSSYVKSIPYTMSSR